MSANRFERARFSPGGHDGLIIVVVLTSLVLRIQFNLDFSYTQCASV